MIKHCLVCDEQKEFGRRYKATTCDSCTEAGLKYCVGCETVKSISDYTKSGLSYRKMCRPCDSTENNEQFKKRYHSEPERMRELQNKYWKDKHEKNKDNPEYKAKNVHKALKHINKKRGADGSHTFEEWSALLIKHNYSCAYCGDSGVALEKDHIVAISKGGSDNIDNITPACRKCNGSKSNKDLAEWKAGVLM